MRDTRKIQHELKVVRRIKTWQLVLLFVVSLVVSATFLRLNNVGMVDRRTAVLAADEEGTSTDVYNRLRELQRYVSTHMNADTGRIALQEQYKQEVDRLKKAAEKKGGTHNTTQQKVQAVCDALGRQQGWYYPDARYVNCVDKEFAKYPSASNYLDTIELPDINQYYHEYISPAWTPDFAGFSVLASFVLVLAIALRLAIAGVLRVMVWRQFRAL